MGPWAVVEEGGREVQGGGSCFQLWFALKSGVHVRYSLAGQDTRPSSERPGRVPVAEFCWSCEDARVGVTGGLSKRGGSGKRIMALRTSRCGHDIQVEILVWAVWSRRGPAWQRQAASLLQGCAGSLMKEAFSVTFRLLSGCSANQAKEAMPCLLAGWGRGGWPSASGNKVTLCQKPL